MLNKYYMTLCTSQMKETYGTINTTLNLKNKLYSVLPPWVQLV